MKVTDSLTYLGDIVSKSGTRQPCIDNRRSKGWAKVAEIEGTLTYMPDMKKVEIGLKLREVKLCNGMLCSTEAWTKIQEKKIERLEQVDMSALRTIIEGGHSKCPKPFYYLEYGLLMFRHIIMMKRLSYHYHIVTREDDEIFLRIVSQCYQDSTLHNWKQHLWKPSRTQKWNSIIFEN